MLQRFAVQPTRRAAVRHTASCAWPRPTIASALGGAGRDEPESGVAHAPPAGFAAGDDGFVASQLGDGGEDGAPVAVEERDDAPHGELLLGEASVDQLFGHRGRKRTARRPVV